MFPKPPIYLPFTKGVYSTAPALVNLEKAEVPEDRLVFQIDNEYGKYLQNKQLCREENIKKYYCENNLSPETVIRANNYIVEKLITDYPAKYAIEYKNGTFRFINRQNNETLTWEADWILVNNSNYRSLFDALCCQVQEDVAICQLQGDKDWLTALHLCSPNHWAAQDKIGQPFDIVHANVPGMEKMMPHYPGMLKSILNKGPFTRFAWGIATDNRLNHHPTPSPRYNNDLWHGRNFHGIQELFLRVERQNLIGFPDVEAFMFTIRTYFYNIKSLNKNERDLLIMAIASMSDESLEYKGLTGKIELIREMLSN